jgi:hypothetical protein
MTIHSPDARDLSSDSHPADGLFRRIEVSVVDISHPLMQSCGVQLEAFVRRRNLLVLIPLESSQYKSA